MKPLFFVLLLSSIFHSCKSDDTTATNETTVPTSEFEIQQLVTDLTATQVLPNVTTFAAQTKTLETAISQFVTTPTAMTLVAAQEAWKVTSQAYAKLYIVNIGVPKTQFMHEQLYNWPAFQIAIDKEINATTAIDVAQLSTKAKGLTAIEYLLFNTQNSSTATILEAFNTVPKRTVYLTAVTTELNVQANRLHEIWSTDGENYAATLNTNTASGLQSSVNMIFNGLFNVVETIKKAKLGKPAGLENTSSTNAETLEAFRSETSLALMEHNIQSVQLVYFNPKGLGISDYVKAISKNEDINTRMQVQFDLIATAFAAIKTPLHTAIDTEKDAIENLYTPIKTLAVLLKTDVSSALSIVITPTDNDGD